jgi:hypothetical protein
MTELNKASQDAIDAARQGDQYAAMLTAIQAAQIVQQLQQPATPPAPVQQQRASDAGKRLAIGVGGSMLMVTVAFAAVALAIAAVSVALVALVVYGIFRDIRRR